MKTDPTLNLPNPTDQGQGDAVLKPLRGCDSYRWRLFFGRGDILAYRHQCNRNDCSAQSWKQQRSLENHLRGSVWFHFKPRLTYVEFSITFSVTWKTVYMRLQVILSRKLQWCKRSRFSRHWSIAINSKDRESCRRILRVRAWKLLQSILCSRFSKQSILTTKIRIVAKNPGEKSSHEATDLSVQRMGM